MSRPVRSAALQAADFLAAVRNKTMNDSDESDEYSEDNDNMNQNNTEVRKISQKTRWKLQHKTQMIHRKTK